MEKQQVEPTVETTANVLKDATMEELDRMLAVIREDIRNAPTNGAGQVDVDSAFPSLPGPT